MLTNLILYFLNLSPLKGSNSKVKGERNGHTVNGLVYVALDENRDKGSNPFKASLFGQDAGVAQLQKHFEQSKEKMKTSPARSVLKRTIELAVHTTNNEPEFRKQLIKQGINTVVHRNNEGRIYGMTFIENESRSVWNGSQLSKNLSANVFNDWWNNGSKPEICNTEKLQNARIDNEDHPKPEPYNMIDFFGTATTEDFSSSESLIGGFGSLLPTAQGEDYEEQQFAEQMKKKKRKKGRRL